MKHSDLVRYAAEWLRSERGFRTILTEGSCSGTVEEPDVIAWKSGRSTLVECKRSRADFLADKKKPFRADAGAGMGRTRLYAAAPGIIRVADLPDRWGLLEITDGGRVQLVVEPRSFGVWNRDGEIVLLAAAVALRNLQIIAREKLVERVAEDVGPYFAKAIARLNAHPLVGEARSVGLIGAIEIVARKGSNERFQGKEGTAGPIVRDACIRNGLMVRAIRDSIVMCPPLIISHAQIDQLVGIIEKSLQEAEQQLRELQAAA